MKHIPTTTTAVDKIKARARALRSSHDSLGHARDAAAVEAGYDHYHHVTQCHKSSGAAKDGKDTGKSRLLSCVYRVIPALIEADPAYVTTLKKAHSSTLNSLGVDALEHQTLQVHSQGGAVYFRTAIHDFLRHIEDSGFVVTQDAASLSQELATLSQIWDSLRRPPQRQLHRTMLQHGFWKVQAGYWRSARELGPGSPSYATSRGIAMAMEELLMCTTTDELALYDVLTGSAKLPRSMNINMHTQQEDYEQPSTFWSRLSAGVSMEMAGLIATLPLERIRASLDDLELISLEPTIVPRDPAQRELYVEKSQRRAASVFVAGE